MKINRIRSLFALAAGLAGASLLILNCAAGEKSAAPAAVAPMGKTGAQLWAETCQRCHNFRSPSSYSGAQWEVVALHMRVRANLTPEAHQKILQFLKSGL